MESKKNEIVVRTSEISKMQGMYLAEKLVRTWDEDFADEDTGEVITIDRNEVIMERGTYLSSKEISEISFFLQSGDVKDVAVSNQKRGCNMVQGDSTIWLCSIKLNGKKKNIYLYSNSLELAKTICIDFVEQKYEGNFKFIGIKELEYSTLISLDLKEEDMSEDNYYYKIEVEITYQNEEPGNQTFIINASNAENAKKNIIEYITLNNANKNDTTTFDTVIVSAKTIPCNDIIDTNFSREYIIE